MGKLFKKAEETLDSTKNELNKTSNKIQKVLDESSASVKTVVNILVIGLAVSILANVITIATTVTSKGHRGSKIVIEKLFINAGGK